MGSNKVTTSTSIDTSIQITSVENLATEESSNTLQLWFGGVDSQDDLPTDWTLELNQRLQQACCPDHGTAIELLRTDNAEQALHHLRCRFAEKRILEKAERLGPIMDNLQAYNSAITTMCTLACISDYGARH